MSSWISQVKGYVVMSERTIERRSSLKGLNIPTKLNNSMRRKEGFTLIELLVVIAIIALLLAILIPTLSLAKRQARSVICQSNLKQWGLIFVMYTTENNGLFPRRTQTSGRWIDVMFDLYSRVDKLRCCPEATIPVNPTADPGISINGETFKAWGKLAPAAGRPVDTYGSYGINHWLYVPGQNPLYGQPAKDYWRTMELSNAHAIPLFMDSRFWCQGPQNDNVLLDEEDVPIGAHNVSGMQRICIDRHNQAINMIFIDQSISKVPLKRLYRFKWSRAFDSHAPEPYWPPWMDNFKE